MCHPQVQERDTERENSLSSGVFLDCNIRGWAGVIAWKPADDLWVLSGACLSERSSSLTSSQAANDEPQKLRDPEEEEEEGNRARDGEVS